MTAPALQAKAIPSPADWVGVVVDFIERGTVESGSTRYAVVCWNEKFPQEEEYMSQLEVVNEAG